MRFFARLVFICNCCFVIAVIMNRIEQAHKKAGNFNGLISINGLEGTLVILGYGAIFVNAIFNIFLLVLFITKSKQKVEAWLRWVNFLFLIIQLFYFLY